MQAAPRPSLPLCCVRVAREIVKSPSAVTGVFHRGCRTSPEAARRPPSGADFGRFARAGATRADAPEKIFRAAWKDPRSLDRARFWDADRGRAGTRRAGLGDGGGEPARPRSRSCRTRCAAGAS